MASYTMARAAKVAMITIAGLSLCFGFWATLTIVESRHISILARKILRGETIDNDVMESSLADFAANLGSCAMAEPSHLLIVRLRFLDSLSERLQIKKGDLELTAVNSDNREVLTCQPTAAFPWLVQFWLNAITGRAISSNWQFLERSYEAGPYEGWIAARRSRIALASFDFAPERLQHNFVREFEALLKYNIFDDGVALYMSASEMARSRLNEAIEMLGLTQQKSFRRNLEAATASKRALNEVGGLTSGNTGRTILP